MSPVVHLVSPALFAGSVKRGVVDGELILLAGGLRSDGLEVRLYDGYRTKIDPKDSLLAEIAEPADHILLLHLWKVELTGSALAGLLRSYRELRCAAPDLLIGAFGYLAASLGDRLNAEGHVVDFIVTAERVDWFAPSEQSAGVRLVSDAARRHVGGAQEPAAATSSFQLPEGIDDDTVVSLSASRGCRARCTFCAYNADLGKGWRPRDIDIVADEVQAVIAQGKTRKIAFFDNDFGGSQTELVERTRALHAALDARNLLGRAQFALNVRSDCLTAESVRLLGEIGVKTVLIGLESFNSRTRARLFGKRVDIPHLAGMVDACDAVGIEVLLSYILWHPLQTLEGVRSEIEEIVAWGRHRIPQFLSRSQLTVVRGTPIERILKGRGLIESSPPFDIRARFVDSHAARWLSSAQAWLQREFEEMPRPGGDSHNVFGEIAQLKLRELEMYRAGIPAP